MAGPAKSGLRLGWPLIAAVAGVIVIVASMAGAMAARYSSAVPALVPSSSFPASLTAASSGAVIPWPADGQAALGFSGSGAAAVHNPSGKAAPIGSTAKLMTALVIAERHPLQDGATGPLVTVTADDVRHYQQAILEDQSVVEVRAGEQISELDLLQGLLIPSANNFGDLLATWDAGSTSSFVASMNARAQALGMGHTHFDDASGFSPATVSTADDLLTLVKAVMANPVLAKIVGEQEATLPVAGKVRNTNALLKEQGVVGVKTGQTDEAGGCLAFAAVVREGTGQRTVYGVVLGQKDLEGAFSAAKALIAAAPAQITTTHAVIKGQPVGSYRAPWGGTHQVVAESDLDLATFGGTEMNVQVVLDSVHAPVAAGAKVGTLTVSAPGETKTVDLVAGEAMAGPGIWWRMTRH